MYLVKYLKIVYKYYFSAKKKTMEELFPSVFPVILFSLYQIFIPFLYFLLFSYFASMIPVKGSTSGSFPLFLFFLDFIHTHIRS